MVAFLKLWRAKKTYLGIAEPMAMIVVKCGHIAMNGPASLFLE